jgi:thiol:disulfide interchange protein DsbD
MVAMLALSGALIAARAGGAAVGWGFQLQSPLVIAVLALVMLGAGLNLAGLFEFGLAIQRIGQSGGKASGPLGAALTGVLAIVVATPCSGPLWRARWAMRWCSRRLWRWRSLPRWGWALPRLSR